ncbi:hypothetical protein DFP72DRAFT_1051562 [Ephemerocybe angulata]|uniref:Uncharacterized protein n=1 Tax=Ephemerocybe angulata TaxID=980116 RepID=A0A8H6HFZ9_9AGAR|nr:hypothetical protein DFP72DRAFT_1051562 [Tulosesus angulatus]
MGSKPARVDERRKEKVAEAGAESIQKAVNVRAKENDMKAIALALARVHRKPGSAMWVVRPYALRVSRRCQKMSFEGGWGGVGVGRSIENKHGGTRRKGSRTDGWTGGWICARRCPKDVQSERDGTASRWCEISFPDFAKRRMGSLSYQEMKRWNERKKSKGRPDEVEGEGLGAIDEHEMRKVEGGRRRRAKESSPNGDAPRANETKTSDGDALDAKLGRKEIAAAIEGIDDHHADSEDNPPVSSTSDSLRGSATLSFTHNHTLLPDLLRRLRNKVRDIGIAVLLDTYYLGDGAGDEGSGCRAGSGDPVRLGGGMLDEVHAKVLEPGFERDALRNHDTGCEGARVRSNRRVRREHGVPLVTFGAPNVCSMMMSHPTEPVSRDEATLERVSMRFSESNEGREKVRSQVHGREPSSAPAKVLYRFLALPRRCPGAHLESESTDRAASSSHQAVGRTQTPEMGCGFGTWVEDGLGMGSAQGRRRNKEHHDQGFRAWQPGKLMLMGAVPSRAADISSLPGLGNSFTYFGSSEPTVKSNGGSGTHTAYPASSAILRILRYIARLTIKGMGRDFVVSIPRLNTLLDSSTFLKIMK